MGVRSPWYHHQRVEWGQLFLENNFFGNNQGQYNTYILLSDCIKLGSWKEDGERIGRKKNGGKETINALDDVYEQHISCVIIKLFWECLGEGANAQVSSLTKKFSPLPLTPSKLVLDYETTETPTVLFIHNQTKVLLVAVFLFLLFI